MKKLILYGAGDLGRQWGQKLGNRVFCFADSAIHKIGTDFCGKKVVGIDTLKALKEDFVIFIAVSEKYKKEIIENLYDEGLGSKIVDTPYWETDSRIQLTANVANTELEGKNFIGSNSFLKECSLGYASYVANRTTLQNVKVGRFTAIGSDVCNIIGQHPTDKFVSIHPAFYSIDNVIQYSLVEHNKFIEKRYSEGNYSVTIGNDVWIGNDVKIMEGVTIADGSIIGTGAVVVKDTEPYSINVGVPAKQIKYRFDKYYIEKLCKIKWWEWDIAKIEEYAEIFEDIEKFFNTIKEC